MYLEFSDHAKARLAEMNVTEDECRSVRSYSVRVFWSPIHRTVTYVGRRVSIAVLKGEMTDGKEIVLTVLWVDEALYKILGRAQLDPKKGPR